MTKTIGRKISKAKRPLTVDVDYVNAVDRLDNALGNLEGLISALLAGADNAELIAVPKAMNLACELIGEAQEAQRDLVLIADQHLAATESRAT